jgi:PAP2 superfamily protein
MRHRQPVAVLALLLSFMIVGFAQYGVYPAVGPAHAFPYFYPWKSDLLSGIALRPMTVGRDPRNCMPSLHFGAALLVWWNSRIWPSWGRVLAGTFLLATAFSTLALGERYLADLVVSFPFALMFQAGWTMGVPLTSKTRYLPLIVGGTLTAVWLVLLRYAIPMFELSVAGTWASVLVTVASSTALEARLATAVKHCSGRRLSSAENSKTAGCCPD